MSPSYKQGDLVSLDINLPLDSDDFHPVLIISCNDANSRECSYTGVMVSSTKYTDRFSFTIDNDMFENPSIKEGSQLRGYYLIHFKESKVKRMLNKMKQPYLKSAISMISERLFAID